MPRNVWFAATCLLVLFALIFYQTDQPRTQAVQPLAQSETQTPSQVEIPEPIASQSDTGASGQSAVEVLSNTEDDLEHTRKGFAEAEGFLFFVDAPWGSNKEAYHLTTEEQFQAQVTAGNFQKHPVTGRLTCLVDYIQVPCNDGGATTFQLDTGKEAKFSVELPNLSVGLHDLILLTFFNPDEHSTETRFRQNSRFMYHFYRTTIYVGEKANQPSVRYTQFVEDDPLAQKGINIFTASKSRLEDPWQTPWHVEDALTGQHISYFVRWNNTQPTINTFALIAFLNFEQVPLQSADPVLYGRFEPHKQANIAAQFQVPKEPGQAEFLVLLVENPYLALDQQAEKETPQPFFVFSSDRVLVNVQ